MRGLGTLALALSLAGLAGCAARHDVAEAERADTTIPARSPAEDRNQPQVPIPEACEVEGIENCRRIGSDLLFGGQPSRDALRELARQGYRTVVSTRGEGELDWDEQAEVDSLGMTFVQIPMAYPIESIREQWVDEFDRLMSTAARPMLMHCSSGNRVAGLWAVWLAEKRGVSAREAMAFGTEAGMTRIEPVVEKRLRPAAE